jgi:prolipoprotein diacylglyceryltransferase
VAWLYFVIYGIGRGTIEFWRGDAVRGVWFGGVSTSQMFSVVSILVGAFLLIRDRVGTARPA